MADEEHAVIIHFQYGLDDLEAYHDLSDKLDEALEGSDVGEFDGGEIAADLTDGFYYLYGPDANALFASIKPMLETKEFLKKTEITLRFGPPEDGVREEKFLLGKRAN